ncbi:MAG: isoprenyl transferase [bacterium]|nr:isoprenyl transferase [bacterium]
MVDLVREQTQLEGSTPPLKVPAHVAIIMDGNGRWAQQRGLPRTEGHRQGSENLRRILRASVEEGVKILTIYAFSTENWSRPPAEVRMLMRILEMFLERELYELHENGVHLHHLGELDKVQPSIRQKIYQAMELTRSNTRITLNVAFNYGGRAEITQAVRRIMQAGIPPDQVTEETISQYLYTAGIPDPDLIIRTSGELRVSNFLIWQGAYSEYYYTQTYWPDFDGAELHRAIVEYSQRKRRFGKTDEQIDDE